MRITPPVGFVVNGKTRLILDSEFFIPRRCGMQSRGLHSFVMLWHAIALGVVRNAHAA